MRKDKKFNPVAYTEGAILGAILVISIVSSIGLAIYNLLHHS
jgi:hypothetical protein